MERASAVLGKEGCLSFSQRPATELHTIIRVTGLKMSIYLYYCVLIRLQIQKIVQAKNSNLTISIINKSHT